MRILFVDGTVGHNPHTLKTKPTGGTLTSLTIVPEGLAKLGHEVYVSSEYVPQGDEELVNGVHYIQRQTSIKKWDVTVFNRDFIDSAFLDYHKEQGIKTVWWLHDLVGSMNYDDPRPHKMNAIVGMSNYNIETYSHYHNINHCKFTLIPNGVDPTIFYPNTKPRNPKLFLVASAPHRGFEAIETVFLRLRKRIPDIDFRVYSSQSLHHLPNSEHQSQTLRRFKQLGMNVLEPISQVEMGNVMREATMLLMPYKIPETCCNLLLQANACHLPTLSTGIGANKEWIISEGTGFLTLYKPHSYKNWVKECADLAEESINCNFDSFNLIKPLTWDEVVNKWDKFLLSLGETK